MIDQGKWKTKHVFIARKSVWKGGDVCLKIKEGGTKASDIICF